MESSDILPRNADQKIDHAHVSQEKDEESQAGDIRDDNQSVVSEERVMVSQDQENMDDEENSTVVLVLYI